MNMDAQILAQARAKVAALRKAREQTVTKREEESDMNRHEQLVKALRGASVEDKAEQLRKAVKASIDGNAAPPTANWNQRRWAAYEEQKALAKLTKADKEATHGPGF